MVGVKVELLELIDDRADRLAFGGSKAGHQHVDLILLDEATCKLLPQSVIALSVDGEEVDFAPQDSFVTGIDENIGILVEYHLGSALVPARVNDVESHPLLADSRRFLRNVTERAEAARTDVGAPFKRLAFVNLFDRKLRGVKLLDSVDRQVS